MLLAGKYVYMGHLRTLAGRTPCNPSPIPRSLSAVNSPLVVDQWRMLLSDHPDEDLKSYLLGGMREGFRIGFNYSQCECKSAKRNMLSARQNPEVVSEYLAKERALGRIIGPLESDRRDIQVNRFGVIPKPHQPGKWRLILDLSHPEGNSVNDGIEPDLCSLTYTSIDDAVKLVLKMGKGTMLAKLDLESAYRVVPVHPQDRLLLGMKWDGKVYIDSALPFGLRSAPKIFTALADTLLWIMINQGIRAVLHYLDDYLFLGSPKTTECAVALQLALCLCKRLGVPVADRKVEGLDTSLVFLGIQLDTVCGELRLPREKLTRLKVAIQQWQQKKSCTKRELLSIIGQLQHACKVVRPGRTILRRMIDLSTKAKEMHRHLRLNAAFRSDLQWWASFLVEWNGISMMSRNARTSHQAVITSDASGSWGCGAFNSSPSPEWFQLPWPESWSSIHITPKELVPIIIVVAVWGKEWQGEAIQCRCDNAAVVAVINSGRSKDTFVMHLMCCLFFFQAVFSISLHAVHLPGKNNVAADCLSRDNLTHFFQQVPIAAADPTSLPAELLNALIHHRPDWTSKTWKVWFDSTLTKV